LLFAYGGIYTDIDNAPGEDFFVDVAGKEGDDEDDGGDIRVSYNNATTANVIANTSTSNRTAEKKNRTTIVDHDTDEAFFVIEGGGFLSQYFMATSAKHPVAFLTVHHALSRLLTLNDVDAQYVPFVTGPGALKSAFIHFMNDQGPNEPKTKNHSPKYNKIGQPGLYVGMMNRTVTVVGTPGTSNRYVRRSVIRNKHVIYREQMNMTHFSKVGSSDEGKKEDRHNELSSWNVKGESCMQRIYRLDPNIAVVLHEPQR